MPAGTLGFRISGRLTREDYADGLIPPLRDAVGAGQRLRVLYQIGPELQMQPSAMWEDVKAGAELGFKHRDAWERIAVVTELDWLWRSFQLFSWMVPGEMRLFHESDAEQAKRWLSGVAS